MPIFSNVIIAQRHMTMNLVVGEFVMINTYNIIIGRSIKWRGSIPSELSNHSFYDNTIVVDEFDCPWVVIIADKWP